MRKYALLLVCLAAIGGICRADLSGEDVLILVNSAGGTGRYIAKMYQEYHPDVPDHHILELDGLTDCSGPNSTTADEIISREDYEQYIAQPVRDYLIDSGLVDQIKVIITTAGMPYRIKDPSYPNVVVPGASGFYPVGEIGYVTAASVESELTLLFQTDPAAPNPVWHYDRVSNPYQGYRFSEIELFERDMLGHREDFSWLYCPRAGYWELSPFVEGAQRTRYGVSDRHFGPGDIYLTCRLDGPKNQGESAVFAVRVMLERARRASSPAIGVDPAAAVVVLDDSVETPNYNAGRLYNVPEGSWYLDVAEIGTTPPDLDSGEIRDDYVSAFCQMTGGQPLGDILNRGEILSSWGTQIIHDLRRKERTGSDDLCDWEQVIAYACFGVNGDEKDGKLYLEQGGDDFLFALSNGAVFASIESFNGVTLFSDASTSQCKAIDFLRIGGTAAIGHSFEPLSDAIVDTEFFFTNLLTDEDMDGRADLTFIEAAFTGLPYLSWTEVVLGDPLMRIAYGPGEAQSWKPLKGDASMDGKLSYSDLFVIYYQIDGMLNNTDESFTKYCDLCDVNRDGCISYADVWEVRTLIDMQNN